MKLWQIKDGRRWFAARWVGVNAQGQRFRCWDLVPAASEAALADAILHCWTEHDRARMEQLMADGLIDGPDEWESGVGTVALEAARAVETTEEVREISAALAEMLEDYDFAEEFEAEGPDLVNGDVEMLEDGA